MRSQAEIEEARQVLAEVVAIPGFMQSSVGLLGSVAGAALAWALDEDSQVAFEFAELIKTEKATLQRIKELIKNKEVKNV